MKQMFYNVKSKCSSAFAKIADQETRDELKKAPFMRKMSLLSLIFLSFFSTQVKAQDAADEIWTVWEEQFEPIIGPVLTIAAIGCGVWCFILFVSGKKEAGQKVLYAVIGAIVLKVLPSIIQGITGYGVN